MDRLSSEDKGVVEVPAWLSEVYTEDILKAVEAKILQEVQRGCLWRRRQGNFIFFASVHF